MEEQDKINLIKRDLYNTNWNYCNIEMKDDDKFGFFVSKRLCLKAIEEEPEFEGEMPDDLFYLFKNTDNKEDMKKLLVKVVQLTKNNIINRINIVVN